MGVLRLKRLICSLGSHVQMHDSVGVLFGVAIEGMFHQPSSEKRLSLGRMD